PRHGRALAALLDAGGQRCGQGRQRRAAGQIRGERRRHDAESALIANAGHMAAIVEVRKAPSFTLEDGAGKRISLEDFKGKNVVVYFYPKDDTPGCTKEACGFRDLWKELQRASLPAAL